MRRLFEGGAYSNKYGKLSSEYFSCVLLKGNYTTFLVQFGIYFALVGFSESSVKLHSPYGLMQFLILQSEKLTRCANKFQIKTRSRIIFLCKQRKMTFCILTGDYCTVERAVLVYFHNRKVKRR